ncbi:type II secretion system GspH family protein [Aromatoleum toluclasticum]|uniref:type II secretion system protein n=1 Tax=Aromatoleum toluclasticum TaxID=92003 RepID=UPI000373EDF1|nr:type II secretion system protein [Aromatoleum toluclasticum]MCC4117055.1 type II secretion system GspH family protein [Aromatoleum toluclasticum]
MRGRQRGYTYLLVLFIIAGLGLLVAQTGLVWHQAAQRDREAELLLIGVEFSRGLSSYVKAGADHSLPESLQQLVEDRRGPVLVRHLRRIYRDPFTGQPVWGLEKAGGRIAGVYSLAQGVPIRQHGLPKELGGPAGEAKSYAEWVFRPIEAGGGTAAGTASGVAPVTGASAGGGAAAPASAD